MKQLPMFDAIEIPLTRGYVALVDPCDADLLSTRWYSQRSRKGDVYAIAENKGMHRIILSRMLSREIASSELVDHADGNGLNNTRANLRLATRTQNGQNRKVNFNNPIGYKGVTRCGNGAWQAHIKVNGKQLYLGRFHTAELAAATYNAAAIEHFGEFARLNAIPAAPSSEDAR